MICLTKWILVCMISLNVQKIKTKMSVLAYVFVDVEVQGVLEDLKEQQEQQEQQDHKE